MIMPKAKELKHPVSVTLKPSKVEEIDKYAEKYNLTRSQLMGNLLEAGLDELRVMDKIGIVPIVYQGSNIMKKFKEKLFNGKVLIDQKGDIQIKK